VKISE